MGQLARVDMHDVVGQGADEINVVADENERALELLQRVDSASMLGMSRCVVGSSISRRLGGSSSSLTSAEAAFFAAAQDAAPF